MKDHEMLILISEHLKMTALGMDALDVRASDANVLESLQEAINHDASVLSNIATRIKDRFPRWITQYWDEM